MTKVPSEEDLRSEVSELTDLLRHDEDFADLRDALTAKGLAMATTVLAGLIEGEDESRYGVAIRRDGKCVLFELASSGLLTHWEEVADLDLLSADFQAVRVGISMVENRETRLEELARHVWGLHGQLSCRKHRDADSRGTSAQNKSQPMPGQSRARRRDGGASDL